MTATVLAPYTAATRRDWIWALTAFAVGLAVWGFVFAREIAAAVAIWDASATYNHCWLVLPIAIWLGWQRRDRLAGLRPEPLPAAALVALAGSAAWLVAERLGIMEGRQLTALGIFYALVLTVFGWRVCLAMAAPLSYLIFLVPFGSFLVPALQDLTAWMIVLGLRLFEIPHYVDALTIEIPAGVFLVAEACAGLRFIIASLAFGALYAFVMFRTPGRRVVVMVLALVVPVVANGIRALGIVLLGHYLGSAEAAAADHLIYGWVFFTFVILLLTVAGLPFRQDAPVTPGPAPVVVMQRPLRGPKLVLSTALALAMGIAAPALAIALQRASGEPQALPVALTPPPGCTVAAAGDALTCGGTTVVARVIAFPARATWSAVVAERLRLVGQDDTALTFTAQEGGVPWRVRQSQDGSAGTTAAVVWLGGSPAGNGIRSRAIQGWTSLRGSGPTPVLAILAIEGAPAPPAGPEARRPGAELRQETDVLRAVIEAQAGAPDGGISGMAARASHGR